MAQCTAMAKSTRKQCRRNAVNHYSVCQVHGAGSPLQGRPGGRPLETGKWSTHLPLRLKARFDKFLRDPNLLNLDAEIALLDTRMGDILDLMIIEGGDKVTWELMNDYYQEAVNALEKGEESKFKKAFTKVGEILLRGNSEWLLWNEVVALVEMRRKTTESERKYMIEQQYMISLDDLQISRNAIANLVLEFLETQENRDEFVRRYREISDETEMRRLANKGMKMLSG